MINLNKQRIAVYLYLFLVFTLIFGLSFTVKGNKITGNFVLEIGNFVNSINISFFALIVLGFLLSLAFSLFIIRHASEIKKEISHKKIKPILSTIVILLIISSLGFGIYFGNENKITGYAVALTNTYKIVEDRGDGLMHAPLSFWNKIEGHRYWIGKTEADDSLSYDAYVITANNKVFKCGLFTCSEQDNAITDEILNVVYPPPVPSTPSPPTPVVPAVPQPAAAPVPVSSAPPPIKDITDITDEFKDLGEFSRVFQDNEYNLYALSKEDGKIYVVSGIKGGPVSKSDTEPLREEATSSKLITKKLAIESQAYNAVWQLLDLTLGQFAFGYVEDYCKAQYDSSDYEGGQTASSYATNTQSLLSGQTTPTTNNCIGNQTTMTAQAQKSIIATGFTYQTSWTVTPCKENVQYTIYLANSINDSIGIATGVANKGTTQSESKQFSYAKNYQFICMQVSDTSIGNNGYACFNVV
ncbi:hypothetical protein HYU09_00905 [Candidatus Woesearchaeota archaeon]|nr:hypothetical protein [Candidatus Woesearchaeota archaeon]